MSLKKRIKREDILEGAAQVIRQGGAGALTARSLASQLGCSTQPLYSEFGSLEALLEALPGYLHEKYLLADCTSYKDFGRVFLRFAAREKELFCFLYLRRRGEDALPLEDPNRERTLKLLTHCLELSPEEADRLHRRMQFYCYGLGVMIATGYRALTDEELERELTDMFAMLVRHYKNVPDETSLAAWMERARHDIG